MPRGFFRAWRVLYPQPRPQNETTRVLYVRPAHRFKPAAIAAGFYLETTMSTTTFSVDFDPSDRMLLGEHRKKLEEFGPLPYFPLTNSFYRLDILWTTDNLRNYINTEACNLLTENQRRTLLSQLLPLPPHWDNHLYVAETLSEVSPEKKLQAENGKRCPRYNRLVFRWLGITTTVKLLLQKVRDWEKYDTKDVLLVRTRLLQLALELYFECIYFYNHESYTFYG